MAGSYGHVDPDNNGRFSLIENMGDAHEYFYAYKNGEKDPKEIRKSAYDEYGTAYIET